MTNPLAHLCHCGHERLFHSSSNNECFIAGCPCAEGFQAQGDEISLRLKDALLKQDGKTVRLLHALAREVE